MLDKIELFEVQLAGRLHAALNCVRVEIAALDAARHAAVRRDIVAQLDHLNAI